MSDDCTHLTVYQASSARKYEFNVSLSRTTLASLKQQITDRIAEPVARLRVFYLGRELKTNGRSLQKLGIVEHFDVRVLHVVVVKGQPPAVVDLACVPKPAARPKSAAASRNSNNEVVLLLDSDSDDDGLQILERAPKRSRGAP